MICWLQDFFKNWAVAVEALATVALVIAAGFQWATMRAQAKQERKRWKREDQFKRLLWFDSSFNSPAMLIARSALGKMMTENPDVSTILGMPKGPAWMPIYFFTQLAQMWKKNLLALEDIAIAYGDYITIMWVEFGRFLEDDKLQDKFKLLEELRGSLAKTDVEFDMKPYPSGLSSAHLDFVKADFWEREAGLYFRYDQHNVPRDTLNV